MKVSDIRSVKLTKRGDNLTGSMSGCKNYVAKHSDVILDIVLLAGTNDLSNKNSVMSSTFLSARFLLALTFIT